MQLYAYDRHQFIVFSCKAQKKTNYCCLECGGILRVREGPHRFPHFYHLKKSFSCRQNGKSEIHLQIQIFIQQLIPETKIEYKFSSINRVADVAWHEKKIVFEIQCSPMSSHEMLSRNQDYKSAGYEMVLILHDSRYNQWRLTQMEMTLDKIPYYYTNWNKFEGGIIYDQWRHVENGLRKKVLPPLCINLTKPYIKKKLGFEGDILSLAEEHPYRQKIAQYEKSILFLNRKKIFIQWLNRIKNALKMAYKNLLRSYCRD